MEQEEKKEYKGLEIEIIDYEYEDVITVSGGLPDTRTPRQGVTSLFSF
ncbi:MAG: hypothetical protein IJJ91_02490 [Synergistaceae bacterium]|nr:hypothetical protein [Synergistaceae bacterium]MBQ6666464.1 hypothetical protein [Synergistaceae bacterium]